MIAEMEAARREGRAVNIDWLADALVKDVAHQRSNDARLRRG
jgi:hypothetical protein